MDWSRNLFLMDNILRGICPVGLNSLLDRALSTTGKSHWGTEENVTRCCHSTIHYNTNTIFQEMVAKKHLFPTHSCQETYTLISGTDKQVFGRGNRKLESLCAYFLGWSRKHWMPCTIAGYNPRIPILYLTWYRCREILGVTIRWACLAYHSAGAE